MMGTMSDFASGFESSKGSSSIMGNMDMGFGSSKKSAGGHDIFGDMFGKPAPKRKRMKSKKRKK